jgi:hypothetical protein
MKLTEAIKHCEDKGKGYRVRCAEEHVQLAEWLKELQRFRSGVLAEKIVDDLFQGGDGKKVERLVLETPDNHINGTSGWCRNAVRDVIQRHLKGAQKCKKKTSA